MVSDGLHGGTAQQVDHLKYVRLRVPKRDGQTLNQPAHHQQRALLDRNLALRESNLTDSGSAGSDFPLRKLQMLARSEAIRLAAQWSNQYLPVERQIDADSIDSSAPVIFSGHQPALFHPGVWYKNLRLHQMASEYRATAINMVVDNDISGAAAIKFPRRDGPRAAVGFVDYDAPGPAVPFEMRQVVDPSLFESFSKRAGAAIKPFVADPLVEQLWPEVLKAESVFTQMHQRPSSAHALAAGRHLLENANGLRTLEVPISRLAGSVSFSMFSGYLIEHIENFRNTYNQVLHRYRKEHGIRSSAHPVPELGRTVTRGGQRVETPFWVWTADAPVRQPLFVCRKGTTGDQIEISNSTTTLATVALSRWQEWLVDQNARIQSTGKGIFIRPRALITTMYARLLASDLFIHGIGGAKYDQLTDQIIVDFFGVEPPAYVTETGTWRLPTGVAQIHPADITLRKQALRNIRFHPETFITSADDQTQRLIDSKYQAIAGHSGHSGLERHRVIEAVNLELQSLLQHQRAAVAEEISLLASQLRESQIFNSREYSFCLHPAGLMDRMRSD